MNKLLDLCENERLLKRDTKDFYAFISQII